MELLEESLFIEKEELMLQVTAHFNHQISNQELVDYIQTTMPAKNTTTVSCIAKEFLFNCQPKSLYPELLYCFVIRFYLDTEQKITPLS